MRAIGRIPLNTYITEFRTIANDFLNAEMHLHFDRNEVWQNQPWTIHKPYIWSPEERLKVLGLRYKVKIWDEPHVVWSQVLDLPSPAFSMPLL